MQNGDEFFMRQALDEARKAFNKGEVPIGAVVVYGDRIVGRGHNLTETLADPTAHAEMQALTPYYDDPKVVAVGECGLDYHWPVPKDAQLALFEAEIRLALELDKPIIVHDRQAHADVYALLKKYRPKGIVHCYSGSAEDAVQLAAQGLYIGFGGACTFNGAKRAAKAIEALPLDAIVLETDCPYMAPEPVRGTRCDSSLIRYVGAYIAQRKALEPEEVFRTTAANARRVFGL